MNTSIQVKRITALYRQVIGYLGLGLFVSLFCHVHTPLPERRSKIRTGFPWSLSQKMLMHPLTMLEIKVPCLHWTSVPSRIQLNNAELYFTFICPWTVVTHFFKRIHYII